MLTKEHQIILLFNIIKLLNKFKIFEYHWIRKFSNNADLKKQDYNNSVDSTCTMSWKDKTITNKQSKQSKQLFALIYLWRPANVKKKKEKERQDDVHLGVGGNLNLGLPECQPSVLTTTSCHIFEIMLNGFSNGERIIVHICWGLGNLKKTYLNDPRQPSSSEVWLPMFEMCVWHSKYLCR